VVERTNGWMKSFRRLRFRLARTTASFEAFLYLAVIAIGVRKAIRS
jgi:transposase